MSIKINPVRSTVQAMPYQYEIQVEIPRGELKKLELPLRVGGSLWNVGHDGELARLAAMAATNKEVLYALMDKADEDPDDTQIPMLIKNLDVNHWRRSATEDASAIQILRTLSFYENNKANIALHTLDLSKWAKWAENQKGALQTLIELSDEGNVRARRVLQNLNTFAFLRTAGEDPELLRILIDLSDMGNLITTGQLKHLDITYMIQELHRGGEQAFAVVDDILVLAKLGNKAAMKEMPIITEVINERPDDYENF